MTTTPTSTIVTEYLVSGYGDAVSESIRAKVFAHMLKRAMPMLEHYHSDLYHDAGFLAKHMEKDVPFYFGVRKTGTDIGLDAHLVSPYNTTTYKVTVKCDQKYRWTVDFETVER